MKKRQRIKFSHQKFNQKNLFLFFSWFKESHHHLLDPLSNDPKIQHIGAAIVIDPVEPEDAGNYR